MSDTQAEVGSVCMDLGALLESADGADVTLVVGDSEVPAHSQILTARSPVFAAMLRNDMKEARSHRIEIKDMGEDVLRQVLSFMYTDTALELGSVAPELLAVADKYDLPLLKKRCEESLARDLTVENAVVTAALAVAHNCPELRDAAVQFMAGHLEVMLSAGWAQVLQENVEAAIEITKKLAQTCPPANRFLPNEQRQFLGKRLVAVASEGQLGEVRELLQLGAPVDTSGGRALYQAASKGCADVVRCLIDAGADVNHRESSGRTPLHAAASNSEAQHAVWMLLAARAHTDVQDQYGETPLHLAAKSGHMFSTKALLLAGARKDIKNKFGRTPGNTGTCETRALFHTQ